MRRANHVRALGLSIVEILVASSVGLIAIAALYSGVVSIQRCFLGAEDYALAKADQARLSDYLALDLRRALTVTVGAGADPLLTVKIPDYYDEQGLPRTPTIAKYTASYGDAAHPVSVVYRKIGSSIYRQENDEPMQPIAVNVADFQLSIEDLGKVVKTQVSFVPRFQRTPMAATRTASTIFNTTLLRNVRHDKSL
jgi:hypothetical protein